MYLYNNMIVKAEFTAWICLFKVLHWFEKKNVITLKTKINAVNVCLKTRL